MIEPEAAPPTRSLAWYAPLPLGSGVQAIAYLWARSSQSGAHLLFWLGTAMIIGGVCMVVWRRRPGRSEAFVLANAVGVLLFLPKFYRSPNYFNFYDELAHWRATQGLLDGVRPFGRNPLNPVVGYYPGLHAATAVLSRATGLSVFAAGNILVLAAHMLLAASVWLIAERYLKSPGAATIALVVYAMSPGFFYFDAQFAYESLALPLVAVVVLLVLKLSQRDTPQNGLTAVAIVLSLAVVITHHASSYALGGILLVIVIATIALYRASPEARAAPLVRLSVVTIVACGSAGVWIDLVAPYTITYLSPLLSGNVHALVGLAYGTTSTRTLFSGSALPTYEIVATYVSILLVVALFVAGGVILWKRDRFRNYLGWTLTLIGLFYLASLPFVAVRSDQVAKRSWGFTFIALAPVAGLAVSKMLHRRRSEGHLRARLVWQRRRLDTLRAVVVSLALVVGVIGGAATLSGINIRFPGPYQPSSDPRAMTAQVVTAAEWLQATAGTNNRIVADRDTEAIFASYGMQYPIAEAYEGYLVGAVFKSHTVSPFVLHELRRSRTRYVVVDTRLPTAPPLTGYYFDKNEPSISTTHPTITREDLAKFNGPQFERIYDNGTIEIFRFIA